jgi:hypothetical protein
LSAPEALAQHIALPKLDIAKVMSPGLITARSVAAEACEKNKPKNKIEKKR